MLLIRNVTKTMKLRYKFASEGQNRFVYLNSGDLPLRLDKDDLGAWLHDARDDNPDLYAELVHIYILLCKPAPHS